MLRRYAARGLQELHLQRCCVEPADSSVALAIVQQQMQAWHCLVQHSQLMTTCAVNAVQQLDPGVYEATFDTCTRQQNSQTHIQPQIQNSNQTGLPIAQQLHQEYLKLQALQQAGKHEQQPVALQQATESTDQQNRNSSSSDVQTVSHSGPTESVSEQVLHTSDRPHPEDAFDVTSLQQQYELTLDSLQMGRSKNISQLARMFDPHAVLAAPDKGAAILEALMFGAAKLGDMQLLAELLRCCQAAQVPLSSTGHTAVLHGLAHSGQASRAKRWLQEEVPRSVLDSSMLRAVVQPLLQQGQVHIADEILQWATGIMAPSGTKALPEATDRSTSSTAAADEGILSSDSGVLEDPAQIVPCLQLMVAGARRSVAAVQAQWAAIQQQQEELLQEQQSCSRRWVSVHHPHVLSVTVWGSYVSALCKASKSERNSIRTVQPLIRYAVEGLADVYHTTAWNSWARLAAARHRHRQQQDVAIAETADSGSAWWQQQQQQAQQTWQQMRHQLTDVGWQHLDPAAVLPQEVAQAVGRVERDALMRSLEAALHVAADQLDSEWVDELLKISLLLKVMPSSWSFDALLNSQLWQGATPEALEELLGELMGWGVVPTLAHYEHLAEAYALHGDSSTAAGLVDRMYAAGHTPVLRTYNRLLHGIAMRGDLRSVSTVYLRMKMQGLIPDEQTMRALFKCVRNYASNVRVQGARQLAQLKPGDRRCIATVLSQRSGLFATAYSQLVEWQGEMVANGLKHTDASMHQFLGALERLGAMDDCIQLAQLHEEMKPGSFTAHKFALQAASRVRNVDAASKFAALAARLTAGDQLSRQDYSVLVTAQFWLNRDHQQLLQTIAAMRAAGHQLDQTVLLQVLHVYCHHDMWGEALRLLDDVAAGKVDIAGTDHAAASSNAQRRKQHASSDGTAQGLGTDQTGPKGRWPRQYRALDASLQAEQDTLWHVVMRKLWEQRAADGLLNEFLQRMSPEQLQRFKVLYNLRPAPGGGFTMQPLEDWQTSADSLQQTSVQQQPPLDGRVDFALASSDAELPPASEAAESRLEP